MAFTLTDAFKHCAPALRTDIQRCGTVALCTAAKPETAAELETIYKSDDEFRVLGAMLATAMEIKACGIVQQSFEDFWMANMKPVRKNLQPDNLTKGIQKIKPFILADQKSPINNVYWRVSGGQASGETNWQVDVESKSGIPSDVRSFKAGERVYIQSLTAGGAMNIWSGVVVTSTLVGEKVRLVLEPQNAGTGFANIEDPTTGIMKRGSANVNKTESFCDDEPAYLTNREVEFWIEHTKTTLCSSSRWREWRAAILQNNPLYAKFYDLPEAEANKQKLAAWQSKVFNNFMFGRAISANQTLSGYRSLPVANNFTSATGLGVDGGTCDSWKANVIGVIEQLVRCGRIYDAAGEALDLWSLMDAIYILSRVRQGVASAGATEFDLFTDGSTAGLIDRAFIQLFKAYSANTLAMNFNVESGTNKEFGFYYRRYKLVDKTGGITLNVITHRGLDDYLAEWVDYSEQLADATVKNGGRALWLLDAGGIYMGVVESTRKLATSGRLEDLQRVDPAYLCVEETPTKEVLQVGLTYTAVVECPQAHLLIWNFSGALPVYTESDSRPDYLNTYTPAYY